MTMSKAADPKTLSIDALRQIEEVCTRFESIEKADDRDIDQFLSGFTGAAREALLCELAGLDVELRQAEGVPKQSAEDYLKHADDSCDRQGLAERIENVLRGGEDNPPLRSPRYRFVERVGAGGLSIVWRVFDVHGQRPLAVKLLLPRFANDATAQGRLNREALLTGSLQHPGIPPVYDHGQLDSGDAFFSMKLVDGDTFESILKQRDPSKDDLAHCLGIFEQVSQTLAYAHAQGIIHRDLKPQNVMVGRFGEVQVMDWGMAKRLGESSEHESPLAGLDGDSSQSATDTASSAADSSLQHARHSLTAAGDVLGTPCYMPPEQARGDVESLDQRSDVFGLGAMLFEILMRRRLYLGETAGEVLVRAAAGDHADAITALQESDVDQDLADLCKQCLENDPSARPIDAGEVAKRIAGYLEGVQERLKRAEIQRHEAIVRADAESKRRRTLTATASIVVLVTLLGAAGVGWQWNKAVEANEKATAALDLADKRFEQAQDIVDDYLTEVAQPDGVLARTPGTQALQRVLLEKARDYYELFLAESENNPSVRFETAQAYARLGQISAILDPASSETFELYDKATNLYQQLIDQEGEGPEYLKALAEANGAIGNDHFVASRFPDAETFYSKSIDAGTRLVTLRGDADDVLTLAKSTHNLGHSKSQRGDKKGAEPLLVEALDLTKPLLETHRDESEHLFHISNMYSNAGTFFGFKKGDWKRSLELYEKAVELREHLVEIDSQHRNKHALAGGYNNVGLALYQARRIDEAKAAFIKAAEIREVLIVENPAIHEYAHKLGDTYMNLGTFSIKQGFEQDSLQYYEKSADTFLKLAETYPHIVKFHKEAINAIFSKANINPGHERAVTQIRHMIEVYDRLIELNPDNRSFPRLKALFLCVIPDPPMDEVLQLTNRYQLGQKGTTPAELTVRALVLYRDQQYELASDHLKAIPQGKYDGATWALTALVQHKLDNKQAAKSLEKARKIINKKKFPDYEYFALLREADQTIKSSAETVD